MFLLFAALLTLALYLVFRPRVNAEIKRIREHEILMSELNTEIPTNPADGQDNARNTDPAAQNTDTNNNAEDGEKSFAKKLCMNARRVGRKVLSHLIYIEDLNSAPLFWIVNIYIFYFFILFSAVLQLVLWSGALSYLSILTISLLCIDMTLCFYSMGVLMILPLYLVKSRKSVAIKVTATMFAFIFAVTCVILLYYMVTRQLPLLV